MASTGSIFVVHGRNVYARRALFEFLRSLTLKPLEWNQAIALTNSPSPYIGQVLDAALSQAQAIVVLLTGDDEARLREMFLEADDPAYERDFTPQARPNVLFEAGLAIGRAPDRVIIVAIGTTRPFSDMAGRHTVIMDGSTQKRQELAEKLRHAGCSVDTSGTDWHTAGDFGTALRLASNNKSVNQQSPNSKKFPFFSPNVYLGRDFDRRLINERLHKVRKNAWFWGISLFRTFLMLQDHFESVAQRGVHLRFLILPPQSAAIQMAAFRSLHSNDAEINQQIKMLLSRLCQLTARIGTSSVEVRSLDYLLPYSIFVFDPLESSANTIVRLTAFKVPNETRPFFQLDAEHTPELNDFYVQQFQAAWDASEVVDVSRRP